jgi:NTE family protein
VVLSGGGARGAYQVGVVAGILDVLGPCGLEHAPFNVLCGTSVGAINAGYLASHAHLPDLAIDGLIDAWRSLELEDHLKISLRGLVGAYSSAKSASGKASERPIEARALLDSLPLKDLVSTRVDFEQLHRNVHKGVVHALIISALEIGSGRTTMFIEAPPYATFPEWSDPRRNVRREPIGLQHVLASAALPLVFPPRRIQGEAYCDGGVRFNTPIAPAIRAGADRLVVVSLLSDQPQPEIADIPVEVREASYKNPFFLLGKVLNALLLDPVHYDLQVLERFNKLIETMEHVLDPRQLAEFHRVVREERNIEYRKLSTLVFRPSRDVGEVALEFARHIVPSGLGPNLLHRLANQKSVWQSDLVSFLSFDGKFAERLITMGRNDALMRRDEIEHFFLD